MPKPIIKLRFQNGLDLPTFKKEVWDINGISDDFDFEESAQPDLIIFGPYGNDIPQPGPYQRVGYYCENIKPDLSICEWAFGIPREEEINHPCYTRIQWHGTNPQLLIKPADYNAEEIFAGKKHFCNFFYSHRVPYREEFFKQLSKYKKVDAPGKSMTNMPGIDNFYTGDRWQRKRQFLSEYKFTLAFENDVSPGYQTEKLYDAMQVNSIPIYSGDRYVNEVFNTTSFANIVDIIKPADSGLMRGLEKATQFDFKDIRPGFYNGPADKIKRKLKGLGRDLKMRLEFNKRNVTEIIDHIIQLDRDDTAYLNMLQQPWLINNKPPENLLGRERWIKIFNRVS